MPGVTRFPLLAKPVGYNKSIYPTDPLIYKIVNSINGKIYVGQTIKFRQRLKDHRYALISNRHCSHYLQNSFNKYGIESFYIEILEYTTKDQICLREQYWIETLRSYNKEVGYNILINSPSPWYGKRSLRHRMNISKALKGKHPSKETRQKQSEARKGKFMGKDHPFSRAVNQYDKNMNLINSFDSIAGASRETKVYRDSIDRVLVNKRKTAGGYIWKYKED